MRKLLLLLLLLFPLSSCQIDDEDYETDFLTISDDKVFTENTYYLDVSVNTDKDTLLVSGTIVYVNDEMNFDELYLKIYPNAYHNNQSGDNVSFTYLKVNNQEYDVVFSGGDRTTIYLDLIEELPLGETFEISFEYEFTYWDIDRISNINDVYYTMFFYPFVAMNDEGVWQTDNYTFRGESYYNEIGDYYVSLSVPSTFKVASSGLVLEKLAEGDRDRYHIFLNDGRDFSFSTSERYFQYNYGDDMQYKIFSVRELTDEEKRNTYDYISNAIGVYEDYVGDYPYSYFTLELGFIYGMESTGVIYCSEEISEYTIVHEVIHQWFYSIIGNDQSNYSFIDEALTTYTTFIYFYEQYGSAHSEGYLDYRSSLREDLQDRYELYEGVSLLQKVPDFGDGYGYIIYYHGPTIFRYYVDEFLDGDYTLLKTFLQTYYETYHHQEVSLDAFLDLLETTTNVPETTEWFYLQINSLGDLERMPE